MKKLLALSVVSVLALTGCLSAEQQADVDLVNQARATANKSALSVDSAAAAKAQAWSQNMAGRNVLEHTGGGSKIDPSGLTGWCSLGENVGKGPSIAAVHDAFIASSGHRANIVGNFDRIGTGVYKQGSTYWVTEIFLRSC